MKRFLAKCLASSVAITSGTLSAAEPLEPNEIERQKINYFPRTTSVYTESTKPTVAFNAEDQTTNELVTRNGIKEHRTHQEFPFVLTDKTLQEVSGSLQLAPHLPRVYSAGTALRCMLGWCKIPQARAYAYSIYLDADSIQTANDLNDGSDDRDVVARLLDQKTVHPSCGELCLVLRMARDIDGNHIARGFQNSINARLQQAQKEWKSMEGKDTDTTQSTHSAALKIAAGESEKASKTEDSTPPLLAASHKLSVPFKGKQFLEGDLVVFLWSRDGSLHTFCQNDWTEETFQSQALARALFDVYGGQNPVSARGKNTLVYNVNAMAYECSRLAIDSRRTGLRGTTQAKLEGAIRRRVNEEHCNRSK